MPQWPDFVVGADGRKRCGWCGDDPLYVAYHDREWGVPVEEDSALFEFLILEGAQAGLSWITVLRKREAYRKAFAGFDPRRVARFGADKQAELLGNPGIIRNRLKVAAAIGNARAFLAVQKEFGGFAAYAWSWVGGKALRNAHAGFKTLPATSSQSDAWSKDLKKRGFKFVGSTIIYAHMQATGMVNDHLTGCFRHKQIGIHRFRGGGKPL
jgi:DNA-3-methyladenine glycosylase I